MAVMGVPGKIVRPVKDEELKYMRWLTAHYVELAERYVRGDDVRVRDLGGTGPGAARRVIDTPPK
jgi:hypothetical protein